MKNSNDTIGNRTRDLPDCSAVPQPTALLRAPTLKQVVNIKPITMCYVRNYRKHEDCSLQVYGAVYSGRNKMTFQKIMFLSAVALTPRGSSTVQYSTVQYSTVQHTFTYKQYIEQHIKLERVRAEPRLCEFNPGVCLTTEEKARKNLSQGS